MPTLNKDFITKITNSKSEKKEITYWDDRLSGFGLRVLRKSVQGLVKKGFLTKLGTTRGVSYTVNKK